MSIGRIFGGRYRIERELGAGGLGTVFVARHETLGRDVALKLMHADVAARPEHRQRFEREARALAQLRHPNIVTVLDFGIEDDTSYLVMELAEGKTLDRLVAEERLPVEIASSIVRQLLRALAYAHGNKIIHRDLKPANLIVRRLSDGSVHVVVLDFGIAKILEEDGDPALTRQGAILGTPAYMAPEQASGGATKPSVDVYAAGLVAFETYTGRRPFIETDRAALLRAQLMSPAPMPSSVRPELASIAGLDAFLLRALEKKPVNRYADAGQMLDAFERIVASGASTEVRLSAAGSSPSVPALTTPTSPSLVSPSGVGFVAPAGSVVESPVGDVAATVVVPPASSRPGTKLLVGGAIVAAVAVVGIGIAINRLMAPEPPPVIPPQVVLPVIPQPGAAPVGPNPFDRGVPEELAVLHRTILAGGQPSRGALRDIYQYNARHRDDARGQLLLGRTYADRRWYSDSTEAYAEACTREPASSVDPRLRADLLHFAAMDRFGDPAQNVIVSCLGASAIPEVEAAIAGASDAEKKNRLLALLARLRARR